MPTPRKPKSPLALAPQTPAPIAEGKFYLIRAAGEDSAEVLIYGDIGESWFGESVTAKKLVEDMQALKDKNLIGRINSYGGSVADGIAIYNAFVRHPKDVTMINDGVAVSIASLVLMAGRKGKVQVGKNTLTMVHAPWGYAMGNAKIMREYADVLDIYSKAMASSYADQTGKPVDEILALLTDGVDHWYTAQEAVDAGFADEIIDDGDDAADTAAAAARYRAQAFARFHVPAAVAAAFNPKENIMPQKTQQPPATTEVVEDEIIAGDDTNVVQIEQAAVAKEQARLQKRNIDIQAAAKPFMQREGVAELVNQIVADPKITTEQAREKILAHLGEGAEPLNRIKPGADSADKFRAAAVDAMLVRAGVHRLTGNGVPALSIDLTGNPFRGATLLELAKAALRAAGKNPDGMDKLEVVGQAFQGTSDFPTLLENVMHKTLLQAYAVAADTWSRFCRAGTVSDFRAHNRYRTGSIGNLDTVLEHGEFKRKTIPDAEKASITATTKGNTIGVSRQTIINDDLDALTNLAQVFGRAARRSIEADVYASLALNSGLGPLLNDNKSLFHADHNNIGTGAAITVDAIDADRVVMASQKDVGNNDFLDLRPAILLLPIGLGGAARVINDSQFDPDASNKLQRANKVRGLFRDVVDSPRITGTRRYLFADPADGAVLEVAFLDGNQTPFFETKDGWTVDGAEMKVRLDYAVAGIDFRGAVTNAGA
jgi:ATP-dependent Clp endopeptidase proteolytic subunit ClpP